MSDKGPRVLFDSNWLFLPSLVIAVVGLVPATADVWENGYDAIPNPLQPLDEWSWTEHEVLAIALHLLIGFGRARLVWK